jgi:hypothetical protein
MSVYGETPSWVRKKTALRYPGEDLVGLDDQSNFWFYSKISHALNSVII